jgi:hypothetical protein
VTAEPAGRAPTPVEIREEFERLVVDDLYGPAGGPDELLDVTPQDRYLVGMLAPQRSQPEAGEETDTADPASADDGSLPDAMAKPMLFPSSKGLSFAVPAGTPAVTVTATWGRYMREEGATAESAGPGAAPLADEEPPAAQSSAKPTLVWQRHPAGGAVQVRLPEQGGRIPPLEPDPDSPDVQVMGRAVRRGDALIVSLFLVNNQQPLKRLMAQRWLFQAEFTVTAENGADPVFIGRDRALPRRELTGSVSEQGELAQLDMMYRRYVEFAVGHGTAVHADIAESDPSHAWRIATRSVPRYEVPRTDPPSPGEPGFGSLDQTVFDMRTLSESGDADLRGMLQPLVAGYRDWLDAQESRIGREPDLAEHTDAAVKAVADARLIADRLEAALDLLDADADARDAFRFANHTMWQQRVRTLGAAALRSGRYDGSDAAVAGEDKPGNRSWRPFQLAFLLLNLPALTDPAHAERTSAPLVDLLFFPTGGGKTEAYLGLTAYTFAIRRLQGTRFGRDGSSGMAVLMRYTLRLLTAQQFQRASALVAACEVRRRELMGTDERWRGDPFRIGLWVGATVTPNTSAAANQQVTAVKTSGRGGAGKSSPLQLTACPWCGRELRLAHDVEADATRWRTLTYCSDAFGECPFTKAGEQAAGVVGEGIPVVTVDDEIYRLLPSLVISTADKFAQLPWQGALHLLFGSVTTRCTRHGYRSPDLDRVGEREEKDSHPARDGWPRAQTVAVAPLRPPDLIIQDELHLISGPLGSLTGLYETAIDSLATWPVGGGACRPKVIASTATVRRAADQVHALFARQLSVFPPPVLDVESNYFSIQRPTSEVPGRLYVGVCAFGSRLKSVQARVFITLLAAGKRLFDRYGEAADPYLTMVGYYNALRELAGGRRLIDDDVRSRLYRAGDRGLGRRTLRIVEELTSRKSSADIPATLDQLGQGFSEAGERAYADRRARANSAPTTGLAEDYRPIDVLLATNMISVGVDVPRLGLMVTVGQPKATSEYIQATSRVGRSSSGPGIVVTVYNWARPRDLSHFESFEQYHATFYKYVEALSVTPFAPRAVDRGLTALMVSLVRHGRISDGGQSWNPEPGAQIVPTGSSALEGLLQVIEARAGYVTGDASVVERISAGTGDRRSRWHARQLTAAEQGAALTYKGRSSDSQPLLDSPTPGRWGPFSAPMSLRETEPNVNLQIDLWDNSLAGGPQFSLGAAAPVQPDEDDTEEAP